MGKPVNIYSREDNEQLFDIFICFAEEDRLIADDLCSFLEVNGLRCWHGPVPPESNSSVFTTSTDHGQYIEMIGACRVMVLIHSKSATRSLQVRNRIQRALIEDIPVVCLRMDGTGVAAALSYDIVPVRVVDARDTFGSRDDSGMNGTRFRDAIFDELLRTVLSFLGHAPDSIEEEAGGLFAKSIRGERQQFERLVEEHAGYARHMALQMKARHSVDMDDDDLFGEALIGLVKAIQNFNPYKRMSFTTYVSLCISRQLLIAIKLHERGW